MSKMGLNTGGPLLEVSDDNEKGLYERTDIVVQNDILLRQQNIIYHFRTSNYSYLDGLKNILNLKDNTTFFDEGKKGLLFLNNKTNYPWMLKDPRLCITLKTWLPLLNFIPSILYVFRNPFDVALSLRKRDPIFYHTNRGLKLWYIHNRNAILATNDLCRVVVSYKKIMKRPLLHSDRIYSELKSCGLNIPHRLNSTDINSEIDIKLFHWKIDIDPCRQDTSILVPPGSFHQFLFYFTLLLFCFVLFCFVLFCFVLFCFVLFCFVLFCFALFCFVLFCFVLFCFVLFYCFTSLVFLTF